MATGKWLTWGLILPGEDLEGSEPGSKNTKYTRINTAHTSYTSYTFTSLHIHNSHRFTMMPMDPWKGTSVSYLDAFGNTSGSAAQPQLATEDTEKCMENMWMKKYFKKKRKQKRRNTTTSYYPTCFPDFSGQSSKIQRQETDKKPHLMEQRSKRSHTT